MENNKGHVVKNLKIHQLLPTNIRWFDKVSNQDLWQRANQDPINIQIKQRKCAWIGHTLRKPPSSITRQALKWNPQGKRSRG